MASDGRGTPVRVESALRRGAYRSSRDGRRGGVDELTVALGDVVEEDDAEDEVEGDEDGGSGLPGCPAYLVVFGGDGGVVGVVSLRICVHGREGLRGSRCITRCCRQC